MRRLGMMLVFLMPAAASLGPLVRLGPLVSSRLVSVALIGLAMAELVRRRWMPPVAVWTLLLTLVWCGYGFARLDMTWGFRELQSVTLGLLTSVAVVCLAGAARQGRTAGLDDPDSAASWLRAACRGWLFGWVCTVIPACWELATGKHLPNYLEGAALWIRLTAPDIASYMVNPNLFAFFLVAAVGMMMVGWHLEGRFLRTVYVACILATFPICWFTNSRLILLFLPVYLACFVARRPWFRPVAAMATLSGLVLVLLALPTVAAMRTGVPSPHTGSNYQRLALYHNGSYLIWKTLGAGVGPGRFEYWVLARKAPFDTLGGPPNPHSVLFETASQYGLVVAALALGGLLALVRLGWSSVGRRWDDPRVDGLRWQLLVLSVTLVPLGFANSTWLDSSVTFVQLAGLLLVAEVLLAGRNSPRPVWSRAGAVTTIPCQRRLLRHATGAKR